MASTLEAIVTDIQSTIEGLSGVKKAPAYPPETIPANLFPFVVTYPDSGTIQGHTNTDAINLGAVVIELHISRKDLAFDTEKAYPFLEDIPEVLLADRTFGATADTFDVIDWEFGEMNWGDAQTVGFRFTIRELKYKIEWS